MDKERYWLNKTEMAASIGISVQAFSGWKIKPVKKIGRENFYVVSEVLEVYRERCRRELLLEVKAEAASSDETEDQDGPLEVKLNLEKEKLRLTSAQADHQELKNEMARHEVAPFDFITHVLGKTANEIAGVMDSLPVECMRKLSLSLQDVERVKGITALASDSIANLGSVEWLEATFDEFLVETI